MFILICSELLDKVQNELSDLDLFDLVSDIFQGQLVSQVSITVYMLSTVLGSVVINRENSVQDGVEATLFYSTYIQYIYTWVLL